MIATNIPGAARETPNEAELKTESKADRRRHSNFALTVITFAPQSVSTWAVPA